MTDYELPHSDILIVDDHESNLDILERILARSGYPVRTASSGEQALAHIAHQRPDLILLDIMMPGMTGWDVSEALQADDHTSGIPVIFISALDEIEHKVRAFKHGGVDYITKPFQRQEVLARVEIQLTLYRQRLKIEGLLEKQRSYYERLTQMKDDLLNTASHDLKNPLGIIMGYVAMMTEEPDLQNNPFLREGLHEISRATERMHTLITDLLELARIETGFGIDKREDDLNTFLSVCVKDYSLEARQKNITLSYHAPAQPLWIAFDGARLSQVMHNLISNAIKYTPEGGQVGVHLTAGDDGARVEVRDTGLGIPAEALPQLFEKFYRVETKEHLQQKGTGLGLSIAKAIVEQHDGRIWAESEPGQGTRFCIVLP